VSQRADDGSARDRDATPERGEGRRWRVTRRGFLIATGVAGAGVLLGWRYGVPAVRLAIARRLDGAAPPGGVTGPPDAWFELAPDAPVRLYLSKVEMGQGVHTALAQLAAEELELSVEALEVRSAPSTRGLDDPMGTSASTTVSSSWTPLREAAALLREAVRARAAEHWGVPLADVFAMDGRMVRRDAPETTLGYAEVAALGGLGPFPDDPPPLKPRSEFQRIGRSVPRIDLERKLRGDGGFGLDARLPGMRYGAIARPPRIGATLERAAEGSARDVPGVVDVVIEDGFAGVVATRRSAARRGVAALELTWREPEPLVTQRAIDEAVALQDRGGTHVQREGAPARRLRDRVDVRADYATPMAAHAHLEPQAALVDVRAEGVRAWVATQAPTLVRDDLAELLGRPAEEIAVTATALGGGFGRRLTVAPAREAARLSRAVGAPVHVAFGREEEFQHGYVRPPTRNRLEARVEGGRIEAIRHLQASGDVAFPFLPKVAAAVLGADFGAWRGATIPYGGIPHRETIAQRARLPVATGWWRGLGLLPNVFASESFLDEVARSVGADPVAFRLDHLGSSSDERRAAAVLEAAAEAAGWGTPLPAGRGRGVALTFDAGTWVAQVAEVSLGSVRPRVHRVVAAIDPGVVVNPDGVRAQTEGSVAMGVSSALYEELTVEDGRFAVDNFDGYRLLREADMPDVEVVLLEGDDEPHGVGEPPLGPVAAAVANAVVDAGGPRLRRLPLRLS
jgi:isoquinoline 1-oxidoreductase beta subunit